MHELPQSHRGGDNREGTLFYIYIYIYIHISYIYIYIYIVTLIDKSDGSDHQKGEDYWIKTLKTMAPYGLNIEDSV